MAIIIITHHQKILDYINPTHVHVMIFGTIWETGSFSLAKRIGTEGFDFIRKKYNIIEDVKENLKIFHCPTKEVKKNE